ncbi:uncharacterized protein N7518_007021 [Penicillium psychrosexuale]|uniref:uncharacterized protein n=1 Tax=Penicillium psychrosexuale TaxID=1002107 RepID=UPI0025451172|nr:uncharacterized protein N7518_007021 [Penicillium psychrosexuale]KAJ5790010.1 hypothetical protein N7518_007021 [Penicillium psychrosexuale]
MATKNLQSSDHRDLLDIIDKLRLQGITRWVDLPEIIVCGDQSSGKSSVLEAISGMSFPTKDNLCTRFATELVLRRGDRTSIDVSLIPDPTRPEEEQVRLRSQKFDLEEPLNLGMVVNTAESVMGLDGANKGFSTDILRIELCGPTQPHLTLVDLPGLFRAGNKEQSDQDAELVEELVMGYMKRPRSIIMAVVSAKSDFALQSVTKLARQLDTHGDRTMGLITKPDTLDVGSDSERAYVELAKNNDVRFGLGWHVLKNRDYAMRDASSAERDKAEEEFLSSGVWTELESNQLGAKTLGPRLSNVLVDHIILYLSSIQGDVESGILGCNTILDKLGASRATLSDQRRYLGKVGQDFSMLMQAAVNGEYSNYSFFGDSRSGESYHRRLRAVVQATLTSFEERMRKEGKALVIVDEESDDKESDEPKMQEILPMISRSDYVEVVKNLMRRNRGRELPGTWNPMIIAELFRDQCQPWKNIVGGCIAGIIRAVHQVINDILEQVSVGETTERIRRDIINPKMEILAQNLQEKVTEILNPHYSGHPITYNHYFTTTVQKVQEQRYLNAVEAALTTSEEIQAAHLYSLRTIDYRSLARSVAQYTEQDMERAASSQAVDYMEAYYKVALKNVIDNVGALVVEACLIQKLPTLFMADTVYDLQDTDVQGLASEGKEVVEERTRAMQKLERLQNCLRDLKRFDKHGSAHSR